VSQAQYITLAREKKVRVFEENQALAKNPLFLATYIYFLHFFFTLIKEKSGKVGRKPAKPCVPTVSARPLFK
jgi:hypothetical protein